MKQPDLPLSRRSKKSMRAGVFAAPALIAAAAVLAPAATLYWDSDTNAGNNNVTTGAGLGGGGTWNTLTTSNWWNGSAGADQQWNDVTDDAVFWGTAGAVTLNSSHTASSLRFKSSGYTLTSNSINLGATGSVTVETGTSTIASGSCARTCAARSIVSAWLV